MATTLEQISQETIELTKQAFARTQAGLEKAITTSTGLVGYNLEAPSKKLYPVLSPLRNRIPRTKAPVGSLAANWRSIVGINTANVKASVPFGTRNAPTISYTMVNRSATYKTFGLDDAVQDEAVWLGRGFEDVRAYSALATLQAVMIEEEKILLGGNVTALGAPGAPTVTIGASSGGSGWSTGASNNVYVKVVALPLYGYLNSKLNDLTQNLADHSAPSAAGSVANSNANAVINAQIAAPVNGAFAYAWFVGQGMSAPADTAMYLAAITTVPAVQLTSPPSPGNATLANNNTDTSGDSNAFDGIFPQILPVGATLTTIDSSNSSGTLKKVTAGADITGALVFDMAIANGTGTALTADGAFGIVEFDVVLKALWDNARIGPTLILMNSQEARNVTRKIASSSPARVQLQAGDKDITGGIFTSGYLNKFSSGALTPGNPDVVPFMIHPYLPPGTIIFISERLPYPNNNVPNVLEMEMQQEYADFEWARTQRQYEHGVYAMGVLKHYFPAGCAIIRGIANG